jgi:hypothetical protein
MSIRLDHGEDSLVNRDFVRLLEHLHSNIPNIITDQLVDVAHAVAMRHVPHRTGSRWRRLNVGPG